MTVYNVIWFGCGLVGAIICSLLSGIEYATCTPAESGDVCIGGLAITAITFGLGPLGLCFVLGYVFQKVMKARQDLKNETKV